MATHTQYLNDRREYLHALYMVCEEINTLLASADQESKNMLEEMKDGLSGIESMNVCVCSFSEDRDSLSQWRAYGAGLSGFAIGFPGDFLVTVAGVNQWYLARCVYEPSKQRELIQALVEEVFEQNMKRKNADTDAQDDLPPSGNLCAYLHRYAPILKDPSFRDEKEWRLISRPLSCRSKLYDFREGNSMLIPYYKLPLIDEHQEFRVHEVVVGPTPHPQQSQISVESLLVRHDLKRIPVELSNVPYRSW